MMERFIAICVKAACLVAINKYMMDKMDNMIERKLKERKMKEQSVK